MDTVNRERRKYLGGATALAAIAGAVSVSIPFVKSGQPSARARMTGAAIKADISKLEPGRMITVKWRGKPVWILRRTRSTIETLTQPSHLEKLKDPDSAAVQQPSYAQNQYRSIGINIFVAVGICTHLGCVPSYLSAEVSASDNALYFCPCHGSKFDLAGRVFKNVPAPTNLVIPPHRYFDDETIEIGVDSDNV